MKKISIYLALLLFGFLVSCSKDKEAISEVELAEQRLGSVSYWEIEDAIIDGRYLVKDFVVLDSTNFEPSEWFSFDTNQNTIEVKFKDEPETNIFNYVIDGTNFKIFSPDDPTYQEVMTIKSGSVYDDNFILEQNLDDEIIVVKFVVKN